MERFQNLLFSKRRRRGFTIIEILVAVGLFAIVTLMVGGLAQQIAQMANRAKQTGLAIDLKNNFFSIKKESGPWLDKMRGRYGNIYNGCLPAENVNTSDFNCPAAKANIQDLANEDTVSTGMLSNPKLESLTKGLYWVSAPVLDALGEEVAGTAESPKYIKYDGSECPSASPQTSCPLQSVGFFGRTNSDTTSPPGFIRFIVMMSTNPKFNVSSSNIPMSPQFATLDVGNNSRETAGRCLDGTLNLGTLSNGNPYCVKATEKCSSGIPVGIDKAGKVVCENLPTCPEGSIVLNSSNRLVCEANSVSPCESGSAFLGYYSGAGTPVCIASLSCPVNEVQVGLKTEGNSFKPTCVAVPNPACTDQYNTIYDGNKFSCQPILLAETLNCPNPNDVVVGMKGSQLVCKNITTVIGDPGLLGDPGSPGNPGDSGTPGTNGTPKSANTGVDDSLKIAGPKNLPGNDSNVSTYFQDQKAIWPIYCTTSNGANLGCGYIPGRLAIDPSASISTVARVLAGSKADPYATSRRCMYIKGAWRRLAYSATTRQYKYSTACTGGVLYKTMTPVASRLDMKVANNPADSSGTNISAGDGVAENAAGIGILPTPSQLLSHFNDCSEGDTDKHCIALFSALKSGTDFRDTSLDAGSLEEQFCLVNVLGVNQWHSCGMGCGISVFPVYTKSGKRVTSYKFRYRWVKNYSPSAEGAMLPKGNFCNGITSGGVTKNSVRMAPAMPFDIDNEATDDDMLE